MDDRAPTDGGSGDVQIRPLDPTDHPAAHALRVAAFSTRMSVDPPEEGEPHYIPADRRLGAYDGDRLVGHTGVWPFGQWFRGSRLPMAGVAAVTVAADQRRRGIAGRLLRAALAQARERGDVIACLYPTVPDFYRRSGFAVAGVQLTRRIPTAALDQLPRPADPPRLRPLVFDADVAATARIWDAVAAQGHGRIDRGENRHLNLLQPDDDLAAWVAERDGQVAGVLQVARARTGEDDRSLYTHTVKALAAADRDTWLSLWHVVGGHASLSAWTRFGSAPHEPLLDEVSLPLHDQQVDTQQWMARLIDVPAAVAGRGWPPGASTAVTLRVHDPLMDGNDGTFRFELGDGVGGLARVDADETAVAMDIEALTALFTGHVSARTLAFQDRLSGGTDADLAALDSAFASPQPWLHDDF